jgi:hypothetical protein
MLFAQHQSFISKRRLFSKQTLFGFIPAAAVSNIRNFSHSRAEDTAILAAKW